MDLSSPHRGNMSFDPFQHAKLQQAYTRLKDYKVPEKDMSLDDLKRLSGVDKGSKDAAVATQQNKAQYMRENNIKPGTKYPATLVMTGDHDDRVVPAHSFKFAATLQAANGGTKPTFIRIDSKAGHGAGKPIGKVIEAQADMWSFVMYNLGMTVKY